MLRGGIGLRELALHRVCGHAGNQRVDEAGESAVEVLLAQSGLPIATDDPGGGDSGLTQCFEMMRQGRLMQGEGVNLGAARVKLAVVHYREEDEANRITDSLKHIDQLNFADRGLLEHYCFHMLTPFAKLVRQSSNYHYSKSMTTIKQYSASSDRTTGRLLLLAAGAFVVGTGGFVIAGVLPGIAASLRITQSQASLLITVYAIVFAIASPLIAIATSRVPRTSLMVIGLVVVTSGNVLTAVLPTFETVLIARGFGALGAAAFVPAATASAAAIVAPHRRGRAIALVAAGFTGATALGAPIGTAIGAVAGWHTALYFVGALGALVALGLSLSLRRVPLPAAQTIRERFAPLTNLSVLVTLATTLLIVTGQYSAYTFFGAVQERATGGSGTILALLLFVYGVSATVGNLVAGVLADRFGNRRVLETSLVILIIDFLVMPVAGAQLWSAVICIAVWGFSAWAALLAIQHRIVGLSSTAIAWNTSATFFGIALSGPVGSLAISTVGAHSLTLVGAGVLVLATISGMLSHRLVTREKTEIGLPAGEPITHAGADAAPAPGDTRTIIS